ncbi:MAG: hypothetical protein LBG97_08170 [Coriobacteriales bacterium]|jgi:hypothetical protein|nr:hypothetical protein [Coriobacteriales bacterium]
MFENDYIMRMVLQLATVIRKSLMGGYRETKDDVKAIENAISDAVDIPGDILFSLEPKSMVTMLQLGSFDIKLAEYVVRSLYYEAKLLDESELHAKANLRREQANEIANTYAIIIAEEDVSPEALEAFLNNAEKPEELAIDDEFTNDEDLTELESQEQFERHEF